MKNFKGTMSFEDILLTPRYSEINSRQEIDISAKIGKNKFEVPIVASPMDTVTEVRMALKMFERGALGIIHRYNTIERQSDIVRDIRDELESQSNKKMNSISAAIGASGDFLDRAESLYSAGARILCIDVAHGHHKLVESAIKSLRDSYGSNVSIIAGNVATPKGYKDLSDWGADAVRIGIGGGSICSTRIQTGHGVPTFQSVYDCRDTDGAVIIADGGIKTSGDIVKALAAGADLVMLGSMLAATTESPGQVFVSQDDSKYKVYRGMASPEAQRDWRGQVRSREGVSTTIPYKGPVAPIMKALEQNIRSGLSYSGASSIRSLQAKARFIKQSSAGATESSTHILLK